MKSQKATLDEFSHVSSVNGDIKLEFDSFVNNYSKKKQCYYKYIFNFYFINFLSVIGTVVCPYSFLPPQAKTEPSSNKPNE